MLLVTGYQVSQFCFPELQALDLASEGLHVSLLRRQLLFAGETANVGAVSLSRPSHEFLAYLRDWLVRTFCAWQAHHRTQQS